MKQITAVEEEPEISVDQIVELEPDQRYIDIWELIPAECLATSRKVRLVIRNVD
jgi:hypothetical protein